MALDFSTGHGVPGDGDGRGAVGDSTTATRFALGVETAGPRTMTADDNGPASVMSLAEVAAGSSYIVQEVLHPRASLDWPQRLEELGFLPGERVRVLARAAGGEPLSVRVGHSTYALRRQEAACVRVRPMR
jgi:ferrous iron transport protein A